MGKHTLAIDQNKAIQTNIIATRVKHIHCGFQDP